MKKPVYIAASLLLLLNACQTHTREGFVPVLPHENISTYPYPVEAVWELCFELIEENDIDIDFIDTDNMIIISSFIPIDPESELGKAVIFPEEGETIIESAKYYMNVTMRREENNVTTVQLDISISRYTRSLMTYYSWKEQLSNGYIERKFFNDLAAKLAQR